MRVNFFSSLQLALLAGAALLSGCDRPGTPVSGTAVVDVSSRASAQRNPGIYPFDGPAIYRAWSGGTSTVSAYRVGAWQRQSRIMGPLQINQPPLAKGTVEATGKFSLSLPASPSTKNEGTLEHLIQGLGMVGIPGCKETQPLRLTKAGVRVVDARLGVSRPGVNLSYALDNWRGYQGKDGFDTALAFFVYAPQPLRAESVWRCALDGTYAEYRVNLPLKRGWNMAEVSIRSVKDPAQKGPAPVLMKLQRLDAPLPTWIIVGSRGPLSLD